MRLSSVMFFSFSSAMVMFTCIGRDVGEGRSERGKCSKEKPRREFMECSRQQAEPRQQLPRLRMEYRNARKRRLTRPASGNSCLVTIVFLLNDCGLKDAVKRRGAVQPAGPRAPERAPRYRDWWFESGTELHWWCLAAVCSACAAYELPCSPVDRAGSDWTHERVPQKLNRNALQFLLLSCLPGRSYLAPPVQPGSQHLQRAAQFLLPKY